jgi:replicative DNA helicase
LLSDLRESGSIEQDADVVLFVFREEYYEERNMPQQPNTPEYTQWQEKMANLSGKAEAIIGKQRHGPTGTVYLQFSPEVTRFSNLAAEGRLPARRD